MLDTSGRAAAAASARRAAFATAPFSASTSPTGAIPAAAALPPPDLPSAPTLGEPLGGLPSPARQETTPPAGTTRRRFLRNSLLGLAGLGLAGAGYSWRVEPTWLTTREVAIPVAGLPPAFDGFRIVQISDLHHSAVVPTDYLRSAVATANSLSPDLIAVTGDFITRGDHFVEGAAEIVSTLRAPAGVFAVPGNHDYEDSDPQGRFILSDSTCTHLTEALSRSGIVTLRNRPTEIRKAGQSLQLVGCDDPWYGLFDPAAAFKGVDPSRPVVVLSHNPDTIDKITDPAAGRRADLVLCGHTHGGQVRLPVYGPPVVPVVRKDLTYGLYRQGSTQLYVNPGLGYTYRVRFNCRPEVTALTLRRA
jgi:predicted MPP superfamily phosphohydrolase